MKVYTWLVVILLSLFSLFYLTREKKTDFYVFFNHDQRIVESLSTKLHQIHTLMPVWLFVKNADAELQNHNIKQQNTVRSLLKDSLYPVNLIPVINNHNGLDWQGRLIDHLLKDPQKQQRLIDNLIQYLQDNDFQSIIFDFEAFSDKYLSNYMHFLEAATIKFHEKNFQIGACISPYWVDVLEGKLTQNIDFLVLMIYDQHWMTSKPGPIASQSWYESTFQKLHAMIPPEKILAGVGNYAYDWPKDQMADDISVLEALAIAKKRQADISMDPESQNPFFKYVNDKNVPHEVWYLDAETFKNQMKFLEGYSIKGAALWQLGSEDPKLWHYVSPR